MRLQRWWKTEWKQQPACFAVACQVAVATTVRLSCQTPTATPQCIPHWLASCSASAGSQCFPEMQMYFPHPPPPATPHSPIQVEGGAHCALQPGPAHLGPQIFMPAGLQSDTCRQHRIRISAFYFGQRWAKPSRAELDWAELSWARQWPWRCPLPDSPFIILAQTRTHTSTRTYVFAHSHGEWSRPASGRNKVTQHPQGAVAGACLAFI